MVRIVKLDHSPFQGIGAPRTVRKPPGYAIVSREIDPTIYVVDADEQSAHEVCELVSAHNCKVERFRSAEEFCEELPRDPCGCIVLEVDLPGMSGTMLQEHLRSVGITLPVVMLAAKPDFSVAVQVMRNGAIDCLEKPWHALKLWEAIQIALQKDRIIRIHSEMHADVQERLNSLHRDERQIMDLFLSGATKKAIARQFDVSMRTIDCRRASILRKMRVKSFLELAQLVPQFSDRPRPHLHF